jgi:hypothetical protein
VNELGAIPVWLNSHAGQRQSVDESSASGMSVIVVLVLLAAAARNSTEKAVLQKSKQVDDEYKEYKSEHDVVTTSWR